MLLRCLSRCWPPAASNQPTTSPMPWPPIPPSFEEPADGMAPAIPAKPEDTP